MVKPSAKMETKILTILHLLVVVDAFEGRELEIHVVLQKYSSFLVRPNRIQISDYWNDGVKLSGRVLL